MLKLFNVKNRFNFQNNGDTIIAGWHHYCGSWSRAWNRDQTRLCLQNLKLEDGSRQQQGSNPNENLEILYKENLCDMFCISKMIYSFSTIEKR